jgi:hypothetical protein
VNGKPLAAAMQQRLFGPPGMQNTRVPRQHLEQIAAPYSHG